MNRTVRTVSDVTFVDVVLGAATTCVVEFHGQESDEDTWVTSLAMENGWLSCARLDVVASPLTAHTYGVVALPTYVVFQQGAVVSSTTSVEELTRFLQSVADPAPPAVAGPSTTPV